MKKEDKEGARSGTKGLLKGAATIAAGGFLAKVIGALYRIPLTNIIGGRGLGLYQMAYPLYCLLLTLSATGIPSAIAAASAARVGRGDSDEGVLKAALRLFLTVGGIGSVLMCADPIPRAGGAVAVERVSGVGARGVFDLRDQRVSGVVSREKQNVADRAIGGGRTAG